MTDSERLERIDAAWEWAMTHLRYAAPEQYPIAASEAFAHLDRAINGPDK